MVHRMLVVGLLLLWQPVALDAQAERWPEFRGPTGQGHSTERDVPLEWSESLYVVNDLGIVSCLDAVTGTLHWQQRIGGNHSASPVLAAGRIYFLSEEGVATVIAPGRTFQKLATSELDGATLASMAGFGRSMFIRTQSHLYRLGVR